MTKYCSGCRDHLPLDTAHFNKKRVRKDGSILFQPWCRNCNKRRSRQYYAENPDKHRRKTKERSRLIRRAIQQKIAEYLSTHPCVDCGEKNLVVLDFDHVLPENKEFTIGAALQRGLGWVRISREIEKCDVRCANCHRKRTAMMNNHFKFSWCSGSDNST